VTAFVRDPGHWLYRFSPEEWIRAALAEVGRAEAAYKGHNAKAGLAACRRAAGMALNAALIADPRDGWGRSYVDHVVALGRDQTAPEAVRAAARLLLETPQPGREVIQLGTPRTHDTILEATKDVMAHAYAVVKRNE
jgi:hypothetical protein